MVKHDPVFKALADPTRRSIVSALCDGERTMGELAAPFSMTLPAITKHVDVLEAAGLVHRRKVGRHQRCRLRPEPLEAVAAWIDERRSVWERRLDALAALVEIDGEAGR
jgi:DNA-binding transcriptional ArsR family regulator